MKLKSIEIQGFKSFKQKTKLQFDQSVTGVVGPNGSGKSNIADAVRWVLGEQSAKQLRGVKMDDVIFVGTDTEKPLNFCQVEIVFDNADRWIALDFQEISICRRVFRTGESEYYINKAKARLKDIKELFMDTGIGKEGYSIIGQGRIEEILSAKPEERRQIFEEACGIAKDKYKKDNAVKRLEKTEENLARLNDILIEQKKRAAYLSEQADKARRGLALTEELKQAELIEQHRLYDNAQKKWREMDEKRINDQNMATEAEENFHALSARYDALKTREENEEKAMETARAEQRQAEIHKEELAHRLSLREQEIVYLTRECARLEKDRAELELLRTQLKGQMDGHSDTVDGLSRLKEEQQKALEHQRQIFEQKEKERQDRQKKYDAQNVQKEKAEAVLTELYIKEKTALRLSENYEAERVRWNQEKNALEKERTRLETEKEQWQKVCAEKKAAHDRCLSEKAKADILRTQALRQRHDLTEKLLAARSKAQSLVERKTFYEGLKDHYEGYYISVQNFFKKIKNHPLKQGVLGTLADLIYVEPPYEKVMDTLLSSALQNIVTRNEQDAAALIDWLKKERIGRMTFLPISAITSRPRAKVSGFDEVVVATDVVRSAPELREILGYFLNQTLICRDMDEAMALSRQYPKKYRLATLDGDIINTWGAMVGGYRNAQKSTGLLNKKTEIAAIALELDSVEKQIAQMAAQNEELTQNLSRAEETAAVSLKEEQLLVPALKDAEKNYEDRCLRLKMIEESLERVRTQREKQKADSFFSDEDRQACEKWRQIRDGLNETLEEEKENLALSTEAVEKARWELKDLDNAAAQTERELETARTLHRQSCAQWENCEKNRVRYAEEEEALGLKKTNAEKDIQDGRDALEQANALILTAQNKLADDEMRYKTTREERESVLEERNRAEKIWTTMKMRLEAYERDRTQLMAQMQSILDYVHENYHEDLLTVKCDGQPLSKAAMAELREQLRRVGYFSPDAIEEYAKCREELSFLETQQEDLLQSGQDLKKMIATLNTRMSSTFEMTFDEINRRFQEIFQILFHGGEAALVLEREDILSSGIEITARPPGKKPSSLNLLSGGERSLTAVALLFAIFETNPSPFCLLDEIDAALDEANIYRYTRYLTSFADKTQFIIITHRQSTMEICDTLYGVSMENRGVSKVVSLNLAEYEFREG